MEFKVKQENLFRHFLVKATKKNDPSCNGRSTRNPKMSPACNSFLSAMSPEHNYLNCIVALWRRNPDPRKLFKLKNWRKWILHVANQLDESEKYKNQTVLDVYASTLMAFFCDEKYSYYQKLLKDLDYEQSIRLCRHREQWEEKECIKLANLANGDEDTSPDGNESDEELADATKCVHETKSVSPIKCPKSLNCLMQAGESPDRSPNVHPPNPLRQFSSVKVEVLSGNSHSSNSVGASRSLLAENDQKKGRRSINIHNLYERLVPTNILPKCSSEINIEKSNLPTVPNASPDKFHPDENAITLNCDKDHNSETLKLKKSPDHIPDDDVVIQNPTSPCSLPSLLSISERQVSRCNGESSKPFSINRTDSFSTTLRRRSSETKCSNNESRRTKGNKIRHRPFSKESFTQNVDNNTIQYDFELPNLDDVVPIDQDKGDYPATVDEIDIKYPRPPTAPSLTLEMFQEFKKVLSKPAKEKIVEGFSLIIRQQDLAILNNETEWLTDRNIDFYLELIRDRSTQSGFPRVYIFHSFFYTLLTDKDGGYEAVEKTTGEHDIFKYDIVFIPVNLNQHWRLVVIKFDKKSLICYDSMGRDNSDVVKNIKTYLKREYRRKHKNNDTDKDKLNTYVSEDRRMSLIPYFNTGELSRSRMFVYFNLWGVEKEASEVCRSIIAKTMPQQKNSIDCGVFVLQYAEYISRKQDFDFDQSHIPYFRKRMMFETLTKSLLASSGIENLGKSSSELVVKKEKTC